MAENRRLSLFFENWNGADRTRASVPQQGHTAPERALFVGAVRVPGTIQRDYEQRVWDAGEGGRSGDSTSFGRDIPSHNQRDV